MNISGLCSEYGASYADIRISKSRTQRILTDRKDSNVSDARFSGFGVRVLRSGSWGFYYGTDIGRLDEAFSKAVKISKRTADRKIRIPERKGLKDRYNKKVKVDPFLVEDSEKFKWLNSFRGMFDSPETKDVSTALLFIDSNDTFLDSHGTELEQDIVRSLAAVSIVGSRGTAIRSASFRKSDSAGYEMVSSIDTEKEAAELKKKLSNMLSARRAPAGRFKVVCDPKLTGLFFHEAVGHACEADYVINGSSVLRESLGKAIASESVTLSDDPNLLSWGHYRYDDEGTRAREKVLIEKGVLKNYLHSIETAAVMGAEPTSNGRAMSTQFMPVPRMSVLKVEPGDISEDEMNSMENVIFASGFTGGEVDLVKGNFIFGCEEAFMAKDGNRTPLRDVSFSGNIIEILKNVAGVGRKAHHTYSGGMCGKKGQSVPVSEIMPYMVVSDVYVGGENI